jgi:hypothetical protein
LYGPPEEGVKPAYDSLRVTRMRKEKPIVVPADLGKRLKRHARIILGTVKPARVITPKTLRPPKYKKPAGSEES